MSPQLRVVRSEDAVDVLRVCALGIFVERFDEDAQYFVLVFVVGLGVAHRHNECGCDSLHDGDFVSGVFRYDQFGAIAG